MGSIDLILEVFQMQNHGQTRQANSNLEGAYFHLFPHCGGAKGHLFVQKSMRQC